MIVVACIRIGVKEMMKSVQILGIFWRWKVRMCWQRKSIREKKQTKIRDDYFFRPEQWERESIDLLIGFREIEFIDF